MREVPQMSTLRLAAFAAGLSCMANAQTKPFSVCQALTSVVNHQEVIVLGKVAGSVHGMFLSEGIKGDPCPGSPRRFFTSPSLIGLEFTSSYGVRLTNEQEQMDRDFLARLHRLRIAGQLENLKVTLNGVLVRDSLPLILRRTDGSYHGFGLGPEGGLSAVMVIKAILAESMVP